MCGLLASETDSAELVVDAAAADEDAAEEFQLCSGMVPFE